MTRTLSTLVLVAMLAGCRKGAPADGGRALGPEVTETTKTATTPPQVQEMIQNFQRVHFNFDSADLDTQAKNALSANAKIMKDHADIKLEVQGHADERGTTEYNLALGDRRARAVEAYLEGQGVASSRITAISYGEEVPLSRAHGEVAWSENRRAEFRLTWGAEGIAEGTTR